MSKLADFMKKLATNAHINVSGSLTGTGNGVTNYNVGGNGAYNAGIGKQNPLTLLLGVGVIIILISSLSKSKR